MPPILVDHSSGLPDDKLAGILFGAPYALSVDSGEQLGGCGPTELEEVEVHRGQRRTAAGDD
jgi:hypothetical protein